MRIGFATNGGDAEQEGRGHSRHGHPPSPRGARSQGREDGELADRRAGWAEAAGVLRRRAGWTLLLLPPADRGRAGASVSLSLDGGCATTPPGIRNGRRCRTRLLRWLGDCLPPLSSMPRRHPGRDVPPQGPPVGCPLAGSPAPHRGVQNQGWTAAGRVFSATRACLFHTVRRAEPDRRISLPNRIRQGVGAGRAVAETGCAARRSPLRPSGGRLSPP